MTAKGRGRLLGLCLAWLALASWFYAGFFFTDPRIRWQRGMPELVLLARLAWPVVTLALLLLVWRVGTGRTPGTKVALLGVGLLAACVLAYPLLAWIHDRSFLPEELEEYHPYLQLSPTELVASSGDEASVEIYCLGGSTTEFKHDGRGWPARAEERVQEAFPGRAIRIINQGRQWYTAQHSLIHYLLHIEERQPDVVVVMHTVNDLFVNADFSRLSAGVFVDDYRHFHGPVYRLIRRPTVRETAWRLFRSAWYHAPREEVTTKEFPGLATFERRLRSLVRVAGQGGARVLLMTQPCLYATDMPPEARRACRMLDFSAVGPGKRWSLATVVEGMKRYNDVTRRVAETTGAELLDLAAVVPANLDHFSDDVHYKEPAFELIADHVARKLVDMLRPL